MNQYLLNYEEAANYLGVSPKYVKKLCDRHEIGYIVKTRRRGYGRYIRRQRLIPHPELLHYLARQAYLRYVASRNVPAPPREDRA